ncbi:MAG: insulinase family protein [Sphingomonas sp.]
MEDLDKASLDDVKNWFRGHYGPNNAVLVLAGDIDAKEARPLVEKLFRRDRARPRQARRPGSRCRRSPRRRARRSRIASR